MIENTNSSIVYIADGATNSWAIPFDFKNPDVVHAIVKDSSGYHDIQSNYEIDENTNTLIYPTTDSGLPFIENGGNIYIFRLTDITQLETSDLRPFTDKDIERALDKLTVICQDLNRQVEESVKYSPFSTEPHLTADEMMAKIKGYTEQAMSYSEAAENAKYDAILAKEQASFIKNTTEELKEETVQAAKEASDSQKEAYNSQVSAKESEDNARVILEEAQQVLEETAEKVIEEFTDKLEIAGYSSEFFECGTEKGTYTGSLTKFPSKEPFVSNSTYVVVNGAWQQRGIEYTEDPDGHGITFNYDLNVGDVVWVLTAAGFFEKKDIETFYEAISHHDKDEHSHSDLREAIRNAGYEDNSVIELGEFGLKENKIGNRKITFDKEPKQVYIRFSDRNRAMWINGTHSTAGIKQISKDSYSIYYNISSEDFKEQDLLLEPFVVQYVIKYMGEEHVTKSDLDAEKAKREESDLELNSIIGTEVEERENAVTGLANALNQEIEDREAAVTSLNNALTEEQTAREAADTNLTAQIEEETSQRTSQDENFETMLEMLEEKLAAIKAYTPAGSLAMGPVNSMPGYLLCNGQEVSREEYSELYAAIGTNFGAGDGETTFKVPDYRGCFLRGLGGNSAANVFTKQDASTSAASDHFHIFGSNNGNNGGAFVASRSNVTATMPSIPDGSGTRGWNGSGGGGGYNGDASSFTGNMITTMGIVASPKDESYSEARPVNYAVNYFIKY